MKKIALLLACGAILAAGTPALPLDNGLALTPPMGWSTWNQFGCLGLNEKVVKEIADALVSTGMRDAGYAYLNLDDCWQLWRGFDGKIHPDPFRFPHGIKALADYAHARGLKLGLYSDSGRATCSWRPGGYHHEVQDAETYASWGIDYLKYDFCFTQGLGPGRALYEKMRDALKASGRPIVFSICEWGEQEIGSWGPDTGNLWRTTVDIRDEWDSFTENLDLNNLLAAIAGPGGWNDPDMLTVGLHGKSHIGKGMTDVEYRSHFSLWALMAAPLIAGNDIRNMDEFTRDTLLNREVIAVDQDPAGYQGRRVRSQDGLEVWSKNRSDPGERAVILFNRTSSASDITVTWEELGLEGSAFARDLWQHQDLGAFPSSYTTRVEPHGVAMLKVVAR